VLLQFLAWCERFNVNNKTSLDLFLRKQIQSNKYNEWMQCSRIYRCKLPKSFGTVGSKKIHIYIIKLSSFIIKRELMNPSTQRIQIQMHICWRRFHNTRRTHNHQSRPITHQNTQQIVQASCHRNSQRNVSVSCTFD